MKEPEPLTSEILPNFLIVGAAKSGTTSLSLYLMQHPEVFIPPGKETEFFISSYYEKAFQGDPIVKVAKKEFLITDWDSYTRLFQAAGTEKAVGEATAQYLYLHKIAIPLIKKRLDDPKILIMLRNPVDRAYSAYLHVVKETGWDMTFKEFLALEDKRVRNHWSPLHHAVRSGYYFEQVRAYQSSFSEVKVNLQEDLAADPREFMRDIFRFLEVDEDFCPDTGIRWNISGVPRSRDFYRFLFKSRFMRGVVRPFMGLFFTRKKIQEVKEGARKKFLRKPFISPELRAMLTAGFKDDILRLQDMIQRDLSGWLEQRPGC